MLDGSNLGQVVRCLGDDTCWNGKERRATRSQALRLPETGKSLWSGFHYRQLKVSMSCSQNAVIAERGAARLGIHDRQGPIGASMESTLGSQPSVQRIDSIGLS